MEHEFCCFVRAFHFQPFGSGFTVLPHTYGHLFFAKVEHGIPCSRMSGRNKGDGQGSHGSPHSICYFKYFIKGTPLFRCSPCHFDHGQKADQSSTFLWFLNGSGSDVVMNEYHLYI